MAVLWVILNRPNDDDIYRVIIMVGVLLHALSHKGLDKPYVVDPTLGFKIEHLN